MREWVSDRPAQTPSVVLVVTSHDSLTVRFLKERTMSVSKHQWWKPRRKKLMTSLADYTKANTLTIWLQNGFYKLPIHLEYSTHLQNSTNLNQLVDPSSRVVTVQYWTNILICGYIAPAYCTETKILYYKGCNWFHQFYRENKDR